MKYIIWALIGFGVYSGWAFLPVWSTKNAVSRAAVAAAADINDDMSPEVARRQVVRRAATTSLDLDDVPIEVSWDRAPGRRIVYVDAEVPVTVSWLGSERTVTAEVHVTEEVPVDEAAEERRLARKQRHAEQVERIQRVNERIQERKQRAIADCERTTGQKCEVTGFGGPGHAYTDEDQYELKKAY